MEPKTVEFHFTPGEPVGLLMEFGEYTINPEPPDHERIYLTTPVEHVDGEQYSGNLEVVHYIHKGKEGAHIYDSTHDDYDKCLLVKVMPFGEGQEVYDA